MGLVGLGRAGHSMNVAVWSLPQLQQWGGEVSHPLVVFWLFFVIMRDLFLRYKQPHAALAMERKKPINNSHDPLHLFMGKIKHPASIGKVPPPST